MLVIGNLQLLIIALVVLLPAIIIPIWALVDILRNDFTKNNKLIWVLIILFLNVIGAILNFSMARRHKITSA
ncbi:PLDc N-terminal domain-containing protein [Mesonia aquimarina]|uniref:PLDc N-terminal domain-containing protein n=1 Tax=Mesonia aquimarina TaxID=1504967 RepID=UPI000EF57CD8|nr:PLD nuclease N-terminal domain-containing protein [Mesonia aquimarina]